jgi:hypothetical protein
MASYVASLGYWRRAKLILTKGTEEARGEERAKELLMLGKNTIASIADAGGVKGVEKRKGVAIEVSRGGGRQKGSRTGLEVRFTTNRRGEFYQNKHTRHAHTRKY